jgi:hypothetical protein
MHQPLLAPEIEFCLVNSGIVLLDPEFGWIMACVSVQGVGSIYGIEHPSALPDADAAADILLSGLALRSRISRAIAQGAAIHLS